MRKIAILAITIGTAAFAQQPSGSPPAPKLFSSAADVADLLAKAKAGRKENQPLVTERILALGASQLADHRRPDGSGWITLADPEGNEFCILSRDPARSGATT